MQQIIMYIISSHPEGLRASCTAWFAAVFFHDFWKLQLRILPQDLNCSAAAGPKLWNSLPADLRQADISFQRFKWLLKAFMFRC